jgi:hypothetical protein
MDWIDRMLSNKESRNVKLTVRMFLLVFLLFLLVHMIIAFPKIVHAWDGTDLSTDTDVSIGNGTRETVTDTTIIEPGYDVPVTDSENITIQMEIVKVMPTPAGIDQIEVFDYEANESKELEMDRR